MSNPTELPGLYRAPSTPGVSTLSTYADKVCDGIQGLNMVDGLSVLIGVSRSLCWLLPKEVAMTTCRSSIASVPHCTSAIGHQRAGSKSSQWRPSPC